METNNRTLLKGIKRAANYYKCSVASIQKLVNEGVIPFYRIGRNRYFYAEEIDAALKDQSNN
jgi:excisionase family DNA binding protein